MKIADLTLQLTQQQQNFQVKEIALRNELENKLNELKNMLRALESEKDGYQKRCNSLDQDYQQLEQKFAQLRQQQLPQRTSSTTSLEDEEGKKEAMESGSFFQTPTQRQRVSNVVSNPQIHSFDLLERGNFHHHHPIVDLIKEADEADSDLSLEMSKKEMLGTHTILIQIWNLIRSVLTL